MPKLNPVNGKSAMGVLSLVSVDGVIPAPLVATEALGPHWLDATTDLLVYQQDSNQPAPFLQTLDLDTSVLTTVSTTGTSAMSAGGGVWAAYTAAGGVRTNVTGFGPFPAAGLCEVSAEGHTALVNNINSGGIAVYDETGAKIFAISAPVKGNYPQRLRGDILSWVTTDAAGWQMVDISTGDPVAWQRQTNGVFALIPVTLADGRLCVFEMTEEGANQVLWFRQASSATAYRIYTGPAFLPDVIELSPGVVRMAWSVGAGEALTSLRVADLTIGGGGLEMGTTASGALVFSTEDPVESEPVDVAPYGYSEGMAELFTGRTPFVDPKTGVLSDFGWQWVERVNDTFGEPIDLTNNTTGNLPPSQGGTGGSTGLTIIDASNVSVGSLPQDVKWQQYDTSSTGTQNDFVFSLSGTEADVIRCANATTLTLTGLVAGIPGQLLRVIATVSDVVFSHEDVLSVAENRIETFSNADITITVDQGAYFTYDGTSDRWRLDLVSSASGVIASAGYWGPMCAGDTLNWGQINSQVGEWSPLTNGDPVTPELIFNSDGDTISVYTQLQEGPYLPPLVDSQADAIAVWTPTP
jgi:hypothetical protein